MAKRQSGGGDMVLEGRHVLAVFFAGVVLMAVFFTLGYVLGRMQSESAMRGTSVGGARAGQAQAASKTPSTQAASENPPAASPSDLTFYQTVEKKSVDTELSTKPAPAAPPSPAKPQEEKTASPASAPVQPGGIALQVAALVKREDAESMVTVLKRKNYPAFILPPTGDQFYRVQVGPFKTEQAATEMRQRLEHDGFKVITKR